MNNAELIKALRDCAATWNTIDDCNVAGCPFCAYGSMCIDTMLEAAADALESAEKWIAELESNNPIVESVLVDKLNQRIAELEAQLPGVSEWKNQYGDGNWHCSKCGAIVEKDEQERHYWQWCYHCGSKMRKG